MQPVEVTYILRFEDEARVPDDADLEQWLECVIIEKEVEEV